jgi:hypothetical protein
MNHLTFRKLFNRIPAILFWSGMVFLSLLLIHNAMLYFTHGGDYGILPEKTEARKDLLWNICFYIHLPEGSLCLCLPWIGFMRRYSSYARRLHWLMGRLYVYTTIIVVCPTGMYLAIYAKGGLLTTLGFLLQGLLLALYTMKSYQHITGGDVQKHVRYMILSYSVATVVLTFRVLHIAFFMLNVPYQQNYAISQWLGLSLNLLFAEIAIAFSSRMKFTLKHQQI